MKNLNSLLVWFSDHAFPTGRKNVLGWEHPTVECAPTYEFPPFDGEDIRQNYFTVLSNLFDEVQGAALKCADLTKVRIVTGLEGRVQVLLIQHNGKPIPQKILDDLNARFGVHETGEILAGQKHGNDRAAIYLHDLGGRMRIYNIDNDGFTVETRVEIPIKPSST